MTKINSLLSVVHSDTGVQLHLTDAYGHSNACIPLSEDEANTLAVVLVPIFPAPPETIDVEHETVSDPSPTWTDWHALTKAEIVNEVQSRFGVSLDHDDLKADLVAQAEALEEKG